MVTKSGGKDQAASGIFLDARGGFFRHHTHTHGWQISSGWPRRPPYLQTSGELASYSPIYGPRVTRPEDGESEQSLDCKI